MESQKTPNSQSSLEKQQNWGYYNPRFHYLDIYTHTHYRAIIVKTVLAQKWTHRSMAQNRDRDPRNKPIITKISYIYLYDIYVIYDMIYMT